MDALDRLKKSKIAKKDDVVKTKDKELKEDGGAEPIHGKAG